MKNVQLLLFIKCQSVTGRGISAVQLKGPRPYWWGRQQSGRNSFCGVRFWSWWPAASCQTEVALRVQMSRVGGVGHNLTCTPESSGDVQVLERGQVAADHLLGVEDDSHTTLYSGSMGSSFFYENSKAVKGYLGFSILPKDTLACM